jgi:hypothetical protein
MSGKAKLELVLDSLVVLAVAFSVGELVSPMEGGM